MGKDLRNWFRRLEDTRVSLHRGVLRILLPLSLVAELLAPICLYGDLALDLGDAGTFAVRILGAIVVGELIGGELLRAAFATSWATLLERRIAIGAAAFAFVSLAVCVSQGALSIDAPDWVEGLLHLTVIGVLLVATFEGVQRAGLVVVNRLRLPPPFFIVGTFLAVILIGTALLLSPHAVVPGKEPLAPVDALFTATSATCVTGLVTRDTGTDFTFFGQLVILFLIQVGGLGLVTLVAFFSLASSGGLAIGERIVLGNALNRDETGRLGRAVIFVLLATFAIEGIGALILTFSLDPTPGSSALGDGLGARAWNGVFHAISAFCNAGFALDGGSLMAYRERPAIQAVFMVLIVVGGIGFTVLGELRMLLARAIFPPRPRAYGAPLALGTPRNDAPVGTLWPTGGRYLSTQARLVLWTTGALLLSGFIVFSFSEWDGKEMAGLSPGLKLWNGLFQSVTVRTAGFNTVDLNEMSTASYFASTFYMFIGASPGSTGGGFKTTTFAVCLLAIVAIFRGREDVEVAGRRIPERLVRQCLVIGVIQAALVFVITLVLTVTEPAVGFDRLLYEAVSATGTVGLTAGVTPGLSAAGKVAIMIGMFCGRIGPLTLVLSLAARRLPVAYTLPETKVMIG